MSLFLVGLNHQTAPVELRECLFLADYRLRLALEALLSLEPPGQMSEGIIVSTCNRLEIYGVSDHPEAAIRACVAYLASQHNLDPAILDGHLYRHLDSGAVHHLCRVAAGLDSLILGEPQILGQVADALTDAQRAGTAGPILNHLFSSAIHAGKRARTETDISRYTVSVSHAAALLVRQTLGDLRGVRALVIGAGEMAELAARALYAHGPQSIAIISRTFAHALPLAERLGVPALEWNRLAHALIEADVVITATGAPHTVIHAGDVALALTERRGRPLLIVDVAVPRDVDEAVGTLPGVMLHDIDDLQMVIDQHRAQREASVGHVEAIIAEEAQGFLRWLYSRGMVPVIVDLRQKAEAIVEAELEQTLRRLPDLDPRQQEVVSQMARRIVNKLLHQPTSVLKTYATVDGASDYAKLVRELFALADDRSAEPDATRNGNGRFHG